MSFEQQEATPRPPKIPFETLPVRLSLSAARGHEAALYDAAIDLSWRIVYMQADSDAQSAIRVIQCVVDELLGCDGGAVWCWGRNLARQTNLAVLNRWFSRLDPYQKKEERPFFNSEYRRVSALFEVWGDFPDLLPYKPNDSD